MISAMKPLISLLATCLFTLFITIKTCHTPINSDKDSEGLTPIDTINHYKHEIETAVKHIENKVNENTKETIKLDSLVAKETKTKPVITIPKKNRSYLYKIFHSY